MYLFLSQGEFWWGPLLEQIRFHVAASLCGWGIGGGRSRDPHHDVSTFYCGREETEDLSSPSSAGSGFPWGNNKKSFLLRARVFSSLKWKLFLFALDNPYSCQQVTDANWLVKFLTEFKDKEAFPTPQTQQHRKLSLWCIWEIWHSHVSVCSMSILGPF